MALTRESRAGRDLPDVCARPWRVSCSGIAPDLCNLFLKACSCRWSTAFLGRTVCWLMSLNIRKLFLICLSLSSQVTFPRPLVAFIIPWILSSCFYIFPEVSGVDSWGLPPAVYVPLPQAIPLQRLALQYRLVQLCSALIPDLLLWNCCCNNFCSVNLNVFRQFQYLAEMGTAGERHGLLCMHLVRSLQELQILLEVRVPSSVGRQMCLCPACSFHPLA